MKILVLGLGNPILRDDGIGPRIVRELGKYLHDPDVIIEETSLSGMNLMELFVGFDHAIVVDAIKTGERPGKVHLLALKDFNFRDCNITPQHNVSLFQALELGRSLALPIPGEINILAIEAEDVTGFGEQLNLNVEKAIPTALKVLKEEIDKIKQRKKVKAQSTPE